MNTRQALAVTLESLNDRRTSCPAVREARIHLNELLVDAPDDEDEPSLVRADFEVREGLESDEPDFDASDES